MKIVCIEKIGSPFVGIIEKDDAYVTFLFSPDNGGYHEQEVYQKADYQSYDHFIAVISNYHAYAFCLKDPFPIDSISEKELSRAYESIRFS